MNYVYTGYGCYGDTGQEVSLDTVAMVSWRCRTEDTAVYDMMI